MSGSVYAVLIACYMLAFIIAGILLRKEANKSINDYQFASNRFGALVIAFSNMGTWIGSAGLIGLATTSYMTGIASWWNYASLYLVSIPWIVFFASRTRLLPINTFADFYSIRFSGRNNIIQYPVGIISVLRYCMNTAIQLNALAFLMTLLFGWQHWQGVVLMAVVVVVYTALSGFVGVTLTAFVQSLLETSCPIIALIFILVKIGGWTPVVEYHARNGTLDHLSLFQGFDWIKFMILYAFTTGLANLAGGQSNIQTMKSAKSAREGKKGLYLAILFVFPMLLLSCVVGVAAPILLGDMVNPDMVFFEVMRMAPPVVAVLLLYGILSNAINNASSCMFAAGTQISRDIIQQALGIKHKDIGTDKTILINQIGVVLSMVLSIGLSLWFPSIMPLLTTVMSIVAGGLVIPCLFAWFSKRMNTDGAVAGMIAGGVATFVWLALHEPYGIKGIFVGLAACLAASLVGQALGKPPTEREINSTYYFSQKFKDAMKREKETG